MIWEAGSTQGAKWKEGEAQGGRMYLYSSLDLLQGQDTDYWEHLSHVTFRHGDCHMQLPATGSLVELKSSTGLKLT